MDKENVTGGGHGNPLQYSCLENPKDFRKAWQAIVHRVAKRWTYIYMVEYYLAIKNKKILSFATTWMDLEGIMLNEISQT